MLIELHERTDLLGACGCGGDGGDGGYLGVYPTEAALNLAHPPGDTAVGSTATVTTPNGNLFYLSDAPAWVDSGTGYLGDMLKAVYDPTNVEADAFSMGNMGETSTAKVLTNTERGEIAANTLKVSNVTTNLSVANRTATTLDVTSSDGTDATIPQASSTEAGLLNASDKANLITLTDGSNADPLHKHALIQNAAASVSVRALGAIVSIFTDAAERLRVLANGDLQLFNYLNTRNDGTVKDVPTYYPDASGIMQVGRVLPFSSTAVRTVGNVNQADTTYLTYHTHNVTVPEGGLYILDGKFRWSLNSIGDDFQSRILVDTVELATSLHKQEPKDTAGGGVLLEDLNNPGNFVNTGTSQRYLAPIFEAIPLTAGAHVIEFQFTADDSNQEPAVYDIVTRLTRDS